MSRSPSQPWLSGHFLDVSKSSSPATHVAQASVARFDATVVSEATLPHGNEFSGFDVILGVRTGTVRLFLRGELDSVGVPHLAPVLRAAVGSGLRVIVDCADLSFIDAAGIRALLHGRDGCENFALVNCHGPVRRVIEALALQQVLNLT